MAQAHTHEGITQLPALTTNKTQHTTQQRKKAAIVTLLQGQYHIDFYNIRSYKMSKDDFK